MPCTCHTPAPLARRQQWLCLGGPPVARRPAYRYGGQITAAARRHPVFANAAQRSASSAESPLGQPRFRGRSRCPPDRDLEDSDAALNRGMREGCYLLRARRPRSEYGAADLSCLTRASIRGGVTTPSCSIEDKSSRVARCSASFHDCPDREDNLILDLADPGRDASWAGSGVALWGVAAPVLATCAVA